MEVKKITKTDGKRMFVELSKNLIAPPGLPPLKKGDKILLLPKRKFSEAFLDKMIGKVISYFVIHEWHFGSYGHHIYEGTLVEDKEEFWPKHNPTDKLDKSFDEYLKEKGKFVEDNGKRYAVIKYAEECPDGEPITHFTAEVLSRCYDVKFKEPPLNINEKYYNCSNSKCKKAIYYIYKFCPYCRRKNENYKKPNRGSRNG